MSTAADIARKVFDTVIERIADRAAKEIGERPEAGLVAQAVKELRAEFERVVIELRYHVMDAQTVMLDFAAEQAKRDAAAAHARGLAMSEGLDIEVAPHAFVRGSGIDGPPDETCAVCRRDPRNIVHE